MKTATIQIKTCDRCPYKMLSFTNHTLWCEKTSYIIPADDGPIPTWCPLEDAEPKDDKHERL